MATEKRLIDANRALEVVRVLGHEYPNAYHLTNYATLILREAPTVDAVPLSEIYRVIAGHSNYHGDNILAALTCIAEGKDVEPVKPLSASEPICRSMISNADRIRAMEDEELAEYLSSLPMV